MNKIVFFILSILFISCDSGYEKNLISSEEIQGVNESEKSQTSNFEREYMKYKIDSINNRTMNLIKGKWSLFKVRYQKRDFTSDINYDSTEQTYQLEFRKDSCKFINEDGSFWIGYEYHTGSLKFNVFQSRIKYIFLGRFFMLKNINSHRLIISEEIFDFTENNRGSITYYFEK